MEERRMEEGREVGVIRKGRSRGTIEVVEEEGGGGWKQVISP
jgi:hypothetical protein